jgi:hypothetical protein
VNTVVTSRSITVNTTTTPTTVVKPTNKLDVIKGLATVNKVLKSITYGQLPINPVRMKKVFKVGSLSPTGIFDIVDPTIQEQSAYIDKKYWDAKKTRTCVCDPEYGDLDCSARMCQYGNDVMDSKRDTSVISKNHVQLVTLKATKSWADFVESGVVGKTIALTFKSKLNETFTTIPIPIPVFPYNGGAANADSALQDVRMFELNVEWALKGLPNSIVDDVKVHITKPVDTTNYKLSAGASSYSTLFMVDSPAGTQPLHTSDTLLQADGYAPIFQFSVEFTGNNVQGDQYPLSVMVRKLGAGSYPILSGLELAPTTMNMTVIQHSDFNSYECGRRGKCDYDTGICKCFEGYTGLGCNVMTTLV